MNTLSSQRLPLQGNLEGIVVKNRLPLVVALKKSDTLAAAQIDSRNDLYVYCPRRITCRMA
jgi:hypothetical protein